MEDMVMSRKRFSAEEIVNKLRESDVLIARGQSIAQACKQIGVTDQTYYRWRKEYGGLKTDQARRIYEMER
jgi:transposase-like protein